MNGRKMRKSNRWTRQEDEVLTARYRAEPPEQLSAELNRSKLAVYSRIHYLRKLANPPQAKITTKKSKSGRKAEEYIVLNGGKKPVRLKTYAALTEYLRLQPFTSKPLVAKILPIRLKIMLG